MLAPDQIAFVISLSEPWGGKSSNICEKFVTVYSATSWISSSFLIGSSLQHNSATC